MIDVEKLNMWQREVNCEKLKHGIMLDMALLDVATKNEETTIE